MHPNQARVARLSRAVGHSGDARIARRCLAASRSSQAMLTLTAFVFAACSSGGTDTPSSTQGFSIQGDNLSAIGTQWGAFAPDTATYTILNLDEAPVQWSAVADEAWVAVTPESGTVDALQSATVTATLSSSVASLPVGSHTCTIRFSNLTNAIGDATREVSVTVTPVGSPPMTTATRTSGVAPLAVTFDAIGAGSGVVQPPGNDPDFLGFSYKWDYGDPGSGDWANNGKSKNISVGFIGGHVYETPGTYRAQLTVIDDQGTESTYHQDIVVTDPEVAYSNRTFYVAASGSDSNLGTASLPFLTLGRGLTAVQSGSGAARILLRRGDTFTSNNSVSVPSAASPLLLSSYGDGAAPVLEFTGSGGGLSAGATEDLRIVDVDLRSISSTQLIHDSGVSVGDRTLLLRCRLDSFGYGISSEQIQNPAVIDCDVVNSLGYGMYSAGSNGNGDHICMLGNRLSGASYALVRAYTSRSVFMANRFENNGAVPMRLMGRNVPLKSEFITVADNQYVSTSVIVLDIAPENSTSNQLIENVLVEGNRFDCGTPAWTSVYVSAQRVTIRNNIFNLDQCGAVQVMRRGVAPTPSDVRVDSNTAVQLLGPEIAFLRTSDTSPVQVRNNIAYCPGGTADLGSIVNLATNWTSDPLFEDLPNGDWRLRATSPAHGTGTEIGNRVDYSRAQRPLGSPVDIGAFERQ